MSNFARVTLSEKDAPLKEVVEEIGRRMNIDVDTQINKHEKVTTEFNDLTLEDALEIERLSTNYMYLIDSEKK